MSLSWKWRENRLRIQLPPKDVFDTITANTLKAAGTTVLVDGHLKLGTDKELQDVSAGALIAGDNSGNIDQLARIDAAVTTPTGSHEVTLSPQELVGLSQSGTLAETGGAWVITAGDELWLFLSNVFNYLALKGAVYLDSITVYMNSTDNGAFIASTTLRWIDAITGTETDNVTSPFAIGDGSTGNENGSLSPMHTVLENHWYLLQYTCTVAAGELTIRAIKIKYKLT